MGCCKLTESVILEAYPVRPRLYFVKMDIRAAFDTIKQDRMLEIIADLLDKVGFVI